MENSMEGSYKLDKVESGNMLDLWWFTKSSWRSLDFLMGEKWFSNQMSAWHGFKVQCGRKSKDALSRCLG